MLEQKKLPTDFDKVAPQLKAAMDPTMIFADEHRGHHSTTMHQAMNNPAYNGASEIEDVLTGYNFAERLNEMERNQQRAIKKMNAAIQR